MSVGLPKSVYGPFLRFESYTPPAVFGEDATWEGSILYVCHQDVTAAKPPSCLLTDDSAATTVQGHVIDTYKDWNFWRFDLKFVLEESEREISYALQLEDVCEESWSFYIPGATQVWRWSAYSCSGFSHDVKQEDWMVDGDHPMVYHLLQKHNQQPMHLCFGGGDQLYNDDVFERQHIHDWLNIQDRHKRLTMPFEDVLREEAEDYFFMHYCLHFQTRSLRQMCARIPNVMLWDDHDIFDGWGSYPEDMLNSPVFFGIFLVARNFYLLFQHHTTVERVQAEKTDLFGSSPMSSPSFSFLKLIGPTVAILGVDIRSERTKEQVMSQASWNMVFTKARQLPDSVRHLVVNFTVPIVYPKVPVSEGLLQMLSNMNRIAALNALLVKTNILSSLMKFDEPELLDDLVDHWTGVHHSEERRRVVESFQQLAVDRQLRVTFVSGDVHCAAVGRFYSFPKMADLAEDPFFMPQIITSAIINAPPPQVAVRLMHTVDRAGNRINQHTREKMVRFFKSRYPREEKVLAKRNFLIMEGHGDGSLKASIHVEDHARMMHDPEVFVLYVPELKPTVALQSSSKVLEQRRPQRLTHAPPISPRRFPQD